VAQPTAALNSLAPSAVKLPTLASAIPKATRRAGAVRPTIDAPASYAKMTDWFGSPPTLATLAALVFGVPQP
jgi:hypothetical protein